MFGETQMGFWGAWLAWSKEHATLDLRVVSFSAR